MPRLVFTIDLDEIIDFANDNIEPPLTSDEIAKLEIAFFEGVDRCALIHDAIRWLRGQ